MSDSPDPRTAVAELLARERHGVLSTIESRESAFPFGSITPYSLTDEGDPILLLSEIAEHAKNLRADPRASLFVADSRARSDPQAGARVTLLGNAAAVPARSGKKARESYLARFPQAESYFTAHRFSIFVLRVERVRWIAGFGSMGWLDRAELAAEPPPKTTKKK